MRPRNHGRRIEVNQLREKGLSHRQIATLMGISPWSVWYYLQDEKFLKRETERKKGEHQLSTPQSVDKETRKEYTRDNKVED